MFNGTHGHDSKNQRAQQHEIEITAFDENDTSTVWANRTYSLTGFKVRILFINNICFPNENRELHIVSVNLAKPDSGLRFALLKSVLNVDRIIDIRICE